MTGTTISSYTTTNLVLTQASQNPVTITAAGTINTAAANAIYGSYGNAWAIANYGTVRGGDVGVFLGSGGTVTNGSGGATAAFIYGAFDGVSIHNGAGTISHDGTISGGQYFGVYIVSSGTVTNGSSNVTTALISGGSEGVLIGGAGATVSNDGTIRGGYSTGVRLIGGGSVINGSGSDTIALISSGTLGEGVLIEVGTGTVTNDGTISGTNTGVRDLVKASLSHRLVEGEFRGLQHGIWVYYVLIKNLAVFD